MKIRLVLSLVVGCMAFGVATPSFAWEQIGYQQADGKRDRDEVTVSGNDRHKQIRICVENSPVRILDLNVRFANGGKQDVRVRNRFAPGSCSRAIDLQGKRRNINKIVVLYTDKGGDRPAVMKFYAR